MKIGILSDSHRDTQNTRLFIEHLKKMGAEYLIHAGDLEVLENLDILHETGLPYVSVFGNNDIALLPHRKSFNIHKEPHYFSIKNLKFKLMHMPFYLSRDEADIVIYGHTHQVDIKYNDGLLMINPGEICARESGRHEALLLEASESGYRVVHCFKHKDESEINEKITEFLK